jgi:hypothetical protein
MELPQGEVRGPRRYENSNSFILRMTKHFLSHEMTLVFFHEIIKP